MRITYKSDERAFTDPEQAFKYAQDIVKEQSET